MDASIRALLPQLFRFGQAPHPRIFISYRRHGSGAGYGGRIADNVVEKFGADQCFRDVANIESGVDFVTTIQEAVSACEILLAVIGPDWTTQTTASGKRRLDDHKDFVRLEVSAALERNIRVIPVLVGGAAMPTEAELPGPLHGLARRQNHELSDTRWDYDVERLLKTIESIGVRPVADAHQAPLMTMIKKWKTAGAAAAGIAVVGGVLAGAAALIEDNYVPYPEPQPWEQSRIVDPAPTPTTPASYSPPTDSRVNDAPTAGTDADAAAALALIRNLARDQEVQEDPKTYQPPAFNGIFGTSRVGWQHEGVVYDSLVTLAGSRGLALVEYADPVTGLRFGVEQDLALMVDANRTAYVGSNPRVAGTGVPALYYAPDIFKLAQTGQGWTISEVGDSWQHLDPAVVR